MNEIIKTIAFDMNGVLVNERKTNLQERIAKKFKIKNKNWINTISPIIRLSSRGKITKKQTLKKITKTLEEDQNKIKKALEYFYKEKYKINNFMIDFSKKLRSEGYKIIIISNLGYFAKEVLIENENMKHFDNKIISCDVKFSKP